MPWAGNQTGTPNYWAATFYEVSTEAWDEIQAQLYLLGITGIEWEDGTPVESPFTDIPLEPSSRFIRAYFADDEHWSTVRGQLTELANRMDSVIETSWIATEQWETAWKEYYRPIFLPHGYVVVPQWYTESPGDADHTIWLDPGMAFGTGTHATTFMCLEALLDKCLQDKTVLDLGSGSGILAIAAAKHGARHVLAAEPDSVAVKALKANAALNEFSARFTVTEGTLADVPVQQFDLLLLNLIAEIILDEWPRVMQYCQQTSRVILSGILEERVDEVRHVVEASGFYVYQTQSREGWALLEVGP